MVIEPVSGIRMVDDTLFRSLDIVNKQPVLAAYHCVG